MTIESDILVIGSGIGGLSYALKMAENSKVTIITKDALATTNTLFAQGGIASVTYSPDSEAQHIEDTMICGSQMSNKQVVENIVREAPKQIQQLIDWGVDFDKKNDGLYSLAREGGHSQNRILHHKDYTGAEIQHRLIERVKEHKNIEILEYHFAVDLITQHHLGKLVKRSIPGIECYGAYVLSIKTQEVLTFLAKITVIATGGVGNIYHTSTNPLVATGDGIAMAHRAKAKVVDMQYIQFHPTSLYNPAERPSFLITEAMRGYGGILRSHSGEDFMHRYHPLGSLAPRDITARSIDNELKISGDEYLWLDITHKNADETRQHFPSIDEKCRSLGIDITKDMIPVVPAAHYCCGGVEVDQNGQTSINRLYCIGESSSTGLHGANRLASNSLIEAIVYAEFVAKHSAKRIALIKQRSKIPLWDIHGTTHPEEMVLITQTQKELQQIMSYYVGIVRSDSRLDRAFHRLQILYTETEHLYKKSTMSVTLCQVRNMITVGYLIIKQARKMQQSIGLHYSIDYPPTK